MNFEEEFGQQPEIVEEKEYKEPAISPFDFINAINYTKEDIMVDEWSEKQYVPYIVNRGLSFGPDTIIQANEMNSRPHLDGKLQFHFLINSIRKMKRFNKWIKSEKIEALDIIKQYYGYSTEKARQVLPILTDDEIDQIKRKIDPGGIKK